MCDLKWWGTITAGARLVRRRCPDLLPEFLYKLASIGHKVLTLEQRMHTLEHLNRNPSAIPWPWELLPGSPAGILLQTSVSRPQSAQTREGNAYLPGEENACIPCVLRPERDMSTNWQTSGLGDSIPRRIALLVVSLCTIVHQNVKNTKQFPPTCPHRLVSVLS